MPVTRPASALGRVGAVLLRPTTATLLGLAAGSVIGIVRAWPLLPPGLGLAMVARHVTSLLAHLLPAALPCLVWPALRTTITPRMRVLLAVGSVLLLILLRFEVAPRAAFLAHEASTQWSATAMGTHLPETWTSVGFIEFGMAAEDGVAWQELRGRLLPMLVLLAALLPLARSPARGGSLLLPAFATLTCLYFQLAFGRIPLSWLATPVVMLAFATAFSKGAAPPDERSLTPARALVALLLATAAALYVAKNCELSAAVGAFGG